ncbi:MAG: 1-deoxy-D-xylulose-5-phosphate reductoisomerase [Flavobacteriia bacterium]|nr:1-deoxy-D-xylulose-5-phosphate reductoisomerase [Flavobacteriia bacterium]
MKKKGLAILGSTGSIGTQTLEVVKQHSQLFQIELLTANNNAQLLIKQAIEYQAETVIITNKDLYHEVKSTLSTYPIKVYCGMDAICQEVCSDRIDIVLTALVGFSGLKPTIEAIKAKKTIALANKETLVVAGELINKLVQENGVQIIPVDSEHSAIFQCLMGEYQNPIDKIILTASGGPFRTWSIDEMQKITVQQALNHPNWSMGAKITIDSASMMNKGLEIIEAKWLFELKNEQIEVLIHPESIIHSMVQFKDGSIKAQLGLPDMRLPIQFALSYPERLENDFPKINFKDYPTLHFETPDLIKFKNLQLAFSAIEKGGLYPCVLNAVNEINVASFLNEKISFLDIANLNEKIMTNYSPNSSLSLDNLIETDKEVRLLTIEMG